MAASAEPDRARYRTRSRRARRTAIGACRPSRARSTRKKGDSRITATISVTNPRTSSSPPPPPPPPVLLPVNQKQATATASRMTPGITERCICLGGAGRPDRAATRGILVIERAGRAAAKYVATTASAIAGPITIHGSANAPIRWCASASAVGR